MKYSMFAHRIDIDALEEAIGFEVLYNRNGNDTGHCPLPWGLHQHGDTTGKFAIHREKRVWSCWVCGGGSLLTLAVAMNDMTTEEAAKWLYQFVEGNEDGDDGFEQRMLDLLNTEQEQKQRLEVSIPFFNEKVLDRYSNEYVDWFKERGISPNVHKSFNLRYNPEGVRKNIQTSEIFNSPSIILPHFWKGQLVGWQERWLASDRPKWCPKYTNTTTFPRRQTLWGMDTAIQGSSKPIIVESVPTALFLISEGYPAVATFGSSISDEQILHLKIFQNGLVLAPDNDQAGEQWKKKLTDKLRRYVPLDFVPPPNDEAGSDLGDLASEPDRLHNLLK